MGASKQDLNANLRAVSLRCVQQNGPHANGPSYPSELRQRGSADKAEVRTRRDARESSARETSARGSGPEDSRSLPPYAREKSCHAFCAAESEHAPEILFDSAVVVPAKRA